MHDQKIISMNAPGFSMGKELGGFGDLKTFEKLVSFGGR
jgi:hypothetical protein